jgi:hypothetical protein
VELPAVKADGYLLFRQLVRKTATRPNHAPLPAGPVCSRYRGWIGRMEKGPQIAQILLSKTSVICGLLKWNFITGDRVLCYG